ncbi:MAG: cell division protein SepF [Oscillospiraceae bacterium]
MGFVQKVRDMFTEYDDEYDEELEPASEIEDFDQIKSQSGANSYADAGNRSKVVNIHATTQLQVMLVKPERFEDARGIAEHLNQKRTVVLNLESASKELSRRLLDFLSGVAFANNGEVKRVANSTFIITPSNVNLMGDLLDELESSGVYF